MAGRVWYGMGWEMRVGAPLVESWMMMELHPADVHN